MSILDICENADVLKVLRLVNIVITIIKIAVPIMLILSLSINYLNALKDNDADALAKANKMAVPKIIAAVLVFFIPTFVLLIVDTVDPGNRTYISCLNDASLENISEAKRYTAEKYLDKLRESLSRSDYETAKSSIEKIKDQNVKDELTRELNELEQYVKINETISELVNNFDKQKFDQVKTDISLISDSEAKNKLNQILESSFGSKADMSDYELDPNSELYRNLKTLSGTKLSAVLNSNGSSVEKLNSQIANAVKEAGIGTRRAPVVAALTLIDTLAYYGYKINYDWGGKWYHIGVDGNWGTKISPVYCDTHPNPERCRKELVWKGFDCSGFVNWALEQGFNDTSYPIQYTALGNATSLNGKTTAICKIGDVLVNSTHIVLVVGTNDAKKSYIVAESSGGGVKLSYYNYNSSSYYCRHIDYKN